MSNDVHDIAWSSSARRDLVKLSERVATAVIEFLYAQVAPNPRRVGTPLRFGLEGLRSARRGDYRVIYSIDDECRVVRVVTIEHRSDVYRRRA